jgi:hypothetical protein
MDDLLFSGDVPPESFTHARVVIGIVTGLSMARILTGVGRLLQRPQSGDRRALQLAWAAWLALAVTHFWWFEIGPAPGGGWGFGLYLYTILYASLFFFTCVMLFPDPDIGAEGFARYFPAHRAWFYGLLAGLAATDAGFHFLKGPAFVASLGPGYWVKQALLAGLALVAALRGGWRFQAGFAGIAIATQIWWIARTFGVTP